MTKYIYVFNYDHEKRYIKTIEADSINEADKKAEKLMQGSSEIDSYWEINALIDYLLKEVE